MSKRLCALALALVLALAACESGTRQMSSQPSPEPAAGAVEGWNVSCAAEGLSGRMLAVAGADPLSAQLFSVQLCPVSIGRLTSYERFDAVAHGGGVTVVSSARNKTDALERLEVNDLVPIPGLNPGRAFSPTVSSTGRIAYVDPESARERGEESRLRVWDPTTRAESVALASPQLLSTPAYGPDDMLAVAEPTGPGKASHEIVLLTSEGAQRRLSIPSTTVGGMAWSSRGFLAVSAQSDDTSKTLVLSAADGKVAATLPSEWKVRDWAPDGSVLLLRRNDEVGVWREGQADPVVIGKLAVGPIYDASWLPPNA